MARYVPDSAGLEEVARGPIAQDLVNRHTEHLAAAAGDGFVASYQQGRSRYRGIVYPDTWSAIGRNRRDNTLIRVLG
ncbi:hypothetical protein [Corynebacterium glutamicum]|uniref:hypothetical protein n=1 Tax=Corynebacterium glutamicum TaxID=1718 RepID=UPI001B8B88B4|nr:hypothetical protein [Corynebacterium glutamicum]